MKERAFTAKGIALVITFVFGLFLAVEFSYRVYVAGPAALNPFRANSLNTIMRSEFVRLSEYPEIFFELKPDMEGWFRNVPFATNSAGMVGKNSRGGSGVPSLEAPGACQPASRDKMHGMRNYCEYFRKTRG